MGNENDLEKGSFQPLKSGYQTVSKDVDDWIDVKGKVLASKTRMKSIRRVGLAILLVAFIACALLFSNCVLLAGSNPGKDGSIRTPGQRRVIVVSLDGFRYDFLERGFTPNLKMLAEQGILAPLASQFPSYTFPNHFTLVTGLYPVKHGIINNAFYDPSLNDVFLYNGRRINDPKWWLAEPLWNTAETQGVKSGVIFWPGSEVEINGKRPTHYEKYNGNWSNLKRIKQLFKIMDANEDIQLLMTYMSSIDGAGHKFGPDSREVNEALKDVDRAVGQLIKELRGRNLENLVDLVIVSDHGLANQPDEKTIYLDDYIPDFESLVDWVDYGPVTSIVPSSKDATGLYQKLKDAVSAKNLPVGVFLKEDIPERYNYRGSPRIAPIVLEAELEWTITVRSIKWRPRGQHGYDPEANEMLSILIAKGPSITNRGQIAATPIQNLDVYPFLSALLHIDPLANNGTDSLVNFSGMANR